MKIIIVLSICQGFPHNQNLHSFPIRKINQTWIDLYEAYQVNLILQSMEIKRKQNISRYVSLVSLFGYVYYFKSGCVFFQQECEPSSSLLSAPPWTALVSSLIKLLSINACLWVWLLTCPDTAAATPPTETFTLLEGTTGTMCFLHGWRQEEHAEFKNVKPYYTIRYESLMRPFWVSNQLDPEGFKAPNQSNRYEVRERVDTGDTFSVDLIINDVHVIDEDTYVLTVLIPKNKNIVSVDFVRDVRVYSPPGEAKCFIGLSDHKYYLYELHCKATIGSTNVNAFCQSRMHFANENAFCQRECILLTRKHFANENAFSNENVFCQRECILHFANENAFCQLDCILPTRMHFGNENAFCQRECILPTRMHFANENAFCQRECILPTRMHLANVDAFCQRGCILPI